VVNSMRPAGPPNDGEDISLVDPGLSSCILTSTSIKGRLILPPAPWVILQPFGSIIPYSKGVDMMLQDLS
jgi:hypothetical protein